MNILKRNTPLSARAAFIALSVIMFFFSAQVSLTIYVDSSYVSHAIAESNHASTYGLWSDPERMVGTLYTFASLITILGLLFAPRILNRVGNYRWTLSTLILHVLLLLGLALSDSALLIVPFFIVETALVSILYFNFDVFLEHYSKHSDVGEIRGLFLVIGSLAWLFPPIIAGHIVDTNGYPLVYLTGAAVVLPTLFIMMRYFSDFKDLAYDHAPLTMSHKEALAHPNVSRILTTNFFLHFFYAWMVIYAPLYFYEVLGISHQDFGIILTVALTAFVIYPIPLGWLADKIIGEKELLIVGFLLMAGSSLIITQLTATNVSLLICALVLFMGRSGAATVETMSEAYFFKQIDGRNTQLMGYFRRSRPLAYIVAPIMASILLQFSSFELGNLFYILAGIMIIALYFPIRLVDTK